MGWLAAGLLLLLPWMSVAQAQTQDITPNPVTQQAPNGQAFSFDVMYNTSNGANTTGLGLRIYWNSSKVTFNGITNTFDVSRQPYDATFACQDDSISDDDGDPNTNCYFIVAWVDSSVNWPVDPSISPPITLPVRLYTANFTSLITGGPTNINFAAPNSTAGGYTLNPTSATISSGPAHVQLAPDPLGFAQQKVGTTSAAATLTLTNTGGETLNITNYELAPASEFASPSTTCPPTVAPGGSCTFDVTFTPAATGTRTGTLTVRSDANNTPTVATLTGEGVDSDITFNPSPVDFGVVGINDIPPAQTVTVTNVGGADAMLGAIVKTGDAEFTTANDTCSNTTLAANGGNCTIDVIFDPTAQQAYSGTLTVNDNGSPAQALGAVNLTGTGGVRAISMTPDPLAFGNVLAGSTAGPMNVTVANTGNMDLTFNGTGVSITNNAGGVFTAGTNTCPSNGNTLAVGQSCTFAVSFTPAAAQAYSGTVTATTDADTVNSTPPDQEVTLTGTGLVEPRIYVAGAAGFNGNFGDVVVGETGTGTVTITNTGNGDLYLEDIYLQNGAPFSIVSTTCTFNAPMAPGDTCDVVLSFGPQVVGSFSDNLVIVSDAANQPTASFPLTGRGVNLASVPTMSTWGLILMSIMLGLFGFARSRKR